MTGKRAGALAAAVASALFACSPNRDAPAAGGSQQRGQSRQVASADDAVVLVSAAVRRHGLTPLPDRCLQYGVTAQEPTRFVVEVREDHRRPECHGDPQTAPHLFDVRVDRNSGAMSTNANAPADEFRPLPTSR